MTLKASSLYAIMKCPGKRDSTCVKSVPSAGDWAGGLQRREWTSVSVIDSPHLLHYRAEVSCPEAGDFSSFAVFSMGMVSLCRWKYASSRDWCWLKIRTAL